MLVSRCCSEILEVAGFGADVYYVCTKCGKPAGERFVLDGLFQRKEFNDADVQ